jgi:leucyl/phenylalanyl-tRNA---protein transferase
MTVYQLTNDLIFPDPTQADPEGLLAIGGDLTPERLLLAYSMGIFPWYSEGQPLLWWSPDPRLVLNPSQIHISKSLKRVIKSNKFQVCFDSQFSDVIRQCSNINRKNQDGTWITDDMINAYNQLHVFGYAHSVESYFEGKLVGGIYGISLGQAFFGESMFSLMPDASKIALAALVDRLSGWEFDFIDCQVRTDHLVRMGATEISRIDFLEKLHNALQKETHCGSWEPSKTGLML